MKSIKNIYIQITLSILSFLPAKIFAYEAPSVKIKRGTSQIKTIITNIITWSLTLVGITAVLFIIYGGFLYITSAGNKERAESAKKTLTYAVGGLIVVILANIIVSLVSNTVGEFV